MRFFRVYCEEVFTTKDLALQSRNQRFGAGRINRKGRKERKKIRIVGAGLKPALRHSECSSWCTKQTERDTLSTQKP